VPVKKYSLDDFKKILAGKKFIKIAKSLPVQHWDEVPLFVEQSFTELIALLEY